MEEFTAAKGKKFLKRDQRELIKKIVIYFFMVAMLVFSLFPYYYMINISLMPSLESNDLPHFWPQELSLEGYRYALNAELLRYLRNTIYVVVFNCIATPLSASLCAYGFTKIKFQGREVLFGIVLATMMLPAIVVQIPLFVIFTKLGWINTLNPITIPSLFGGGATNIFLLRQFMKGVPNDLLNAAKIDGAGSFRIYWNIMVPLCLPILIYVTVQTFLGVWNDFMGPLLYLKSPENYTLAIGIYQRFMGSLSSIENYPNVRMAIGVLMSVPPAIIFFIFQKQLIEGVTMSGLKG